MGYRLPLITTIAIYVLMVMGALVVGLNAGFVCPDWPLCNGKIIPPLEGLVLVEYTHRLAAAAVTFLILGVAAVTWVKRKSLDRLTKWLVVAGVVCLFLQVSVGALIVVLVLPGAVTTIDVGISMALLASFTALTVHRWRLAGGGRPVAEGASGGDRLWKAAWVTAAATYAEVILGGYFRHTGAGEALFDRGAYLASHQQFILPSKVFSTILFAGHGLFGMLLAGCAVWFFAEAVRSGRRVKGALGFLALVLLEMAAGVVAFALELDLAAVTVHWSGAALLVGYAAYLVTSIWHDRRTCGEAPATPASARGERADTVPV